MKAFFKTILYIPFYNLLIFFAFLTNGSIGWGIILLTILIRALLWWPSIKAAKATTKLQAIQPKMNELKEKHKGDTKKMNEETMKLYKEAGASPLGCCGPMIIQLVVIYILYSVFRIGFDTANYNLLYHFTPRPDAINPLFFGIDLSKPELWILPILAGATQMVLSLMTMPKSDPSKKADPTAMMNKQMTYLFPIMTIFIARSLPSGLALYWVITTLFSLGQQYYVNKVIRKETTPATISNAKFLMPDENPKQIPTSNVQNSGVIARNKAILDNEASISGGIPKNSVTNEQSNLDKKKPDMMTRIVKGRLDKQDKKKGVEITIRQK